MFVFLNNLSYNTSSTTFTLCWPTDQSNLNIFFESTLNSNSDKCSYSVKLQTSICKKMLTTKTTITLSIGCKNFWKKCYLLIGFLKTFNVCLYISLPQAVSILHFRGTYLGLVNHCKLFENNEENRCSNGVWQLGFKI